ncbi:hypothetical protein BDR05DRAFT_55922 [Suillus weaverae]|nr:hypothetical protein BDR05DRAFT_55922 [Suillus weaverae]
MSKKRPSAEFLDASDSTLTDAEPVAPSPAKRPKQGRREQQERCSPLDSTMSPQFCIRPMSRRNTALSSNLSFALVLLSIAVRTPSLTAFPLQSIAVVPLASESPYALVQDGLFSTCSLHVCTLLGL